MLAEITLVLEARDWAANRLRRWQVDISRDLLGAWIADVQFGRIGSRGRLIRCVFEKQPDINAFLRQRLRRRASAKKRIGVDYRYVHASEEARPLLREFGIRPAKRSDNTRAGIP
jgi:predicted DNA-binding WGR domain protein